MAHARCVKGVKKCKTYEFYTRNSFLSMYRIEVKFIHVNILWNTLD